nr:MAG TPA: hypothetical protein [Caudoviricetes sp.]
MFARIFSSDKDILLECFLIVNHYFRKFSCALEV